MEGSSSAAREDGRYLRRLKAASTGAADARLVFLCNFEAEEQWAVGHTGLPAPRFPVSAALVRRMEELGATLAGPRDVLLLSAPLDEDFRAHARAAGAALPQVLVPERAAGTTSTAQAVLDSPRALAELSRLAAEGAWLMPMGTSPLEQRVAEVTGLRLAVPDSATFERVNSKIYGRRLAAEAGLREVPGECCVQVGQLADALRSRYPAMAGGRPVVVKDAYGVSGKGLVVLDSQEKAERLLRMVGRRAERTGSQRLEVVVEEWLPKECDLNYQLTIDRDGRVEFDFVKEALTENGVHRGHLMPSRLGEGQVAELREAAAAIGKALYADGFTGIAGVDAVLGADGVLYPMLEINARLNMSTYQGGVTERALRPGHVALARHYALTLDAPCPLERVLGALGPLAGPDGDPAFGGARLVITCFGTLNALAGESAGAPFTGRLYAVLFAPDRELLAAADAAAEKALSRIASRGEPS